MHYLRKLTISIALIISFGIGAQNPETFKSPKKYLQIGFNFGKFEQEGLAPLHSDIGASLTMFHSFWILKPGTQRFKLGIEASWCDFDYNRYKVNMASEQDGSLSYTFHQGNIGAQIGLGVDFHFNRNLRLHARSCYNPAFSAMYIDDEFKYAFANCISSGLILTWKRIGVGVDFKFGKAKYKNLNFVYNYDDEEEFDEEFDETQQPSSTGNNERIPVKLFNIKTSLVFNF